MTKQDFIEAANTFAQEIEEASDADVMDELAMLINPNDLNTLSQIVNRIASLGKTTEYPHPICPGCDCIKGECDCSGCSSASQT